MSSNKPKPSFWLTSNGLAAMVLIGAVLYFLFVEHREHLTLWLPWLIIALCPLMHIFMHRGHGHGDHDDDRDRDNHSQHKHDE